MARVNLIACHAAESDRVFKMVIESTVLIAWCCVVAEAAIDESYLVDAHETTIGLVHSADVTIEVCDTSFNGASVDPPRLQVIRRWSKLGQLERQRYRGFVGMTTNADGLPVNLGDLLEDGMTVKVLRNWDWASPQSITPHRQGTVRAWYGPDERTTFSGFANPRYHFALFGIQTRTSDTCRTLRQFVKESPSVKLMGPVSLRGHETWKLEMEHPDTRHGGSESGQIVEVYLDPEAGYLIRSLVVHHPVSNPEDPTEVPLRAERDVTKFQRHGDGVYFPVEAEFRLYPVGLLEGRPSLVQRLVGSKITVNQTLPVDAMDFRFPEHAVVNETPAVNGKYKAFLWGPDDKPLRQVYDFDDLGPDPDRRPRTGGTVGWGLVLIAAVGIAVVVLLARRRRAA